MDSTTTLEMLKKKVARFRDDRDWTQFHTPKNLSMNIAIEAAELMELFSWVESKDSDQELQERRDDVEAEVADVACYLLLLCDRAGIDLSDAIEKKMLVNAQKYPLEKARGRSTKYDRYSK